MLWTLLAMYVTYKLVTWALSYIRIKDHAGKYVLITGCGSGFGKMIAKHLDDQGFNVFATCHTSESARTLQQMCSERVTTFVLDVADENSITSARQLVESRLPAGTGLWGLVNNAGVTGLLVPTEWLTQDDWNQCLSVNLFGVINTTRIFLPLLRQAGGRVVNMSSMQGLIVAVPAPYAVSKFGVEAFSDALRQEVKSQGVTVCLVEPGYFKTKILNIPKWVKEFQNRFEEVPDDIKRHYGDLCVERFSRVSQKRLDNASEDCHRVVSAVQLALTSRFPPTRQVVGYDAHFMTGVLRNLPTPVTDWILQFL
ncbi:LOW QUALITY PROTEIN: retinol dehydrogenase 5-like [Babylonia areolata]|uniref:LOW QUALITY PROTEIN: retinol dehydrogenase 5-like n=1 Tax=Babylonia areolata TaxID=304850 RepID=UPI003FD5F0DD